MWINASGGREGSAAFGKQKARAKTAGPAEGEETNKSCESAEPISQEPSVETIDLTGIVAKVVPETIPTFSFYGSSKSS